MNLNKCAIQNNGQLMFKLWKVWTIVISLYHQLWIKIWNIMHIIWDNGGENSDLLLKIISIYIILIVKPAFDARDN